MAPVIIGGALVLDSSVYVAHSGNAGAFGSLSVIDKRAPGKNDVNTQGIRVPQVQAGAIGPGARSLRGRPTTAVLTLPAG